MGKKKNINADEDEYVDCYYCDGKGTVPCDHPITEDGECIQCCGTGKIICPACHGSGRERNT